MFARLQRLVRERSRLSVYEWERRSVRQMRRLLASPLPLAPLDLAAIALAQEFPRAAALDPQRIRSLLMAARRQGARALAIVGDSHSTALVRRSVRAGRWLLPLHLLCTGASARGLANPEAAAGAGAKVQAFLQHLSTTGTPVVFMFGQIDVEFVYTFKRLEAGALSFDPADFDAFTGESVDRYVAFLAQALPPDLKPSARVASIFPPALSDAAWRQGYVNAHIAELHGPADARMLERLAELEIPSLAERTRLHAGFNERLAEAARAAGIGSLDLFAPFLGNAGVVLPAFVGKARGADHHLGYTASRPAVIDRLWEAAV